LREHKVHGTVTGIERVRTLASLDDQLDRLLVSYRDAKVCVLPDQSANAHPVQIALLEWSEETADLLTVSLHTYERAPQLVRMIFTVIFRSCG
jgi:cleavage and polyadenylation specificity factor subunit 1